MNDTAPMPRLTAHSDDGESQMADMPDGNIPHEYMNLMDDWNIVTNQYPGVFDNWNASSDILATLASMDASNEMLNEIEARIANGAVDISGNFPISNRLLVYFWFVPSGKNAKAGAIPWMVSIRKYSTDKHFCGGVLYDDSWVITAASCLPE